MKILNYRIGSVDTNCYLIYDEQSKKACLIDPAAYDLRVEEAIANHELVLEYIILTHGHFDHILGASDFKNKTGAKIASHELEAEYLENPDKNYSGFGIVHADILLTEGDIIKFGDMSLKLMHTPGHTKGSSCFICESHKVIFSGDTLFKQGIGRYDLHGGDYSTLIDSLDKLKNLVGDYKIYPGHGGTTTLEAEMAENMHFR